MLPVIGETCEAAVATVTIDGSPYLPTAPVNCTFPFTYKNELYYGCANHTDSAVPFCATGLPGAAMYGECAQDAQGQVTCPIQRKVLLFDFITIVV